LVWTGSVGTSQTCSQAGQKQDFRTRPVTDDDIADALRRAASSEQACRDLLELALERGGKDNITVLVARAPRAAATTT
jgi:protein phosphatase